MVKYGKEFRKNQNLEWKEKYFDYKAKKQLIKELIKKREGYAEDDFSLLSKLETWTQQFEECLDKDIKKVYIFFSNKERSLYKSINESLHLKEKYADLDLGLFLNEFKKLKEISELSLNLSHFIYYNLKAVIKILKKFDKKVITPKNKDYQIKIKYIQNKIQEQNSDIFYLMKFKLIDEVNVILENLINNLMKEFKSNKEYLEEDPCDKQFDNKLIEEVPELKEATKIIKESYDKIKANIQAIDKVSARVQKLFFPWKDILKISTDINSKFMQITRESVYKEKKKDRTESLVQFIGFSKSSKYNTLIILLHGFLYMFSFSVIIPFSSLYMYSFDLASENRLIYWTVLMMMAPVGTLINYIYEAFLFKKSTKKPIIFSCFGLIIGNVLYTISSGVKYISLLLVGRFICGLFNLRTHNKMYILNFLTKKDKSFYLTMFHTSSILGLTVGFFTNCGLLFIDTDNEYFNKCTIGSLISAILSFILFIFTIVLFTEAYSNKFNISSMQMFGEGISLSEEENMNSNADVANNVRHQTMVLKDIDIQLGSFNKENRFDDTNLVSKSVSELAMKEEERLNYLLKDFIVYILIIFTTKFINESIIINSYIFFDEEGYDNHWIISLILGSSCLLILAVELSLSRKHKFITERVLIIILLLLLLIVNSLFISLEKVKLSLYFLIALDTIITNITEKYVAHLFLYIMPENYVICKINGNVFINIFSMLSRIICCTLLLLSKYKGDYNYIIFSTMAGLCFICFILYLIFFKEIRIKAINRILDNNPTDEIKIATEL